MVDFDLLSADIQKLGSLLLKKRNIDGCKISSTLIAVYQKALQEKDAGNLSYETVKACDDAYSKFMEANQ